MKTLHLVCNAHMDPVWQWRWSEGLGAALSTFRVAADFCEQFDQFVFCHNESLLYEWVEQHDPKLLSRITRLIKSGRWKIMGGWYLQPDCNMPAGESIVRQIQVGYEYFKEKFGVEVHTAINVDSFGHSKGLVQILQKAGYTGYVLMRPDSGTGLLEDLPQRFCWEGYADTRIKGYRLNTPYNTLYGTSAKVIEDYIAQNDTEETVLMRFWGIGDHGGGPSRVDLTQVNELIARKKDEVEIVHSTPDAFMDALDINTLPTFERDLNPIDAGCYTSMHRVKQLHRRLEGQLMMAERVASLCDMCGLVAYPSAQMPELWKDLLFSQFHDILPGTSIKPAEEDAIQRLYHGLEATDRILIGNLYALAQDQQPPEEGDIPLLVLNPHPYPVTEVFSCEFMLADQNWTPNFTSGTVYQNGVALPTQMEKEHSSMNLDWRKQVCFTATLAPLSVNRFDCHLETLPEKPFRIRDLTALPEYCFEANGLVCVFDTSTGTMKSLQRDGVNFIRPGFGGLAVYRDDCDPWLINGKSITEKIGEFRLLDREEATRYAACEVAEVSPMRIIEDGNARTCIEVLLGYGQSYARMLYRLPKQGGDIQLEYTVHWNEKDTMLRAMLPHALQDVAYTGQDMFGNKKLTTEYEMVAQRWVMAEEQKENRALAVLNDSCYGTMLQPDAIFPSMLRAPTYTCHRIEDRPRLPLERYYPRMDQGEHTFRFAILIGTRDELRATADKKAQVFNEFPIAVSAFCGGYEKREAAIFRVENVRMDTCKKAKDGKGYILRLFNYQNESVSARIFIDVLKIDVTIDFIAQEFKTVYVSDGYFAEADLLTEKIIK
ncbi:MAG: glycoside hydrolase family 38 C-terminal domain-containing protein [Oscillospiraceae bacterium]|nr:glycoside hydrolase family 38 C-terminal domain-containing protein [Oscillospiraceae bacterium]MDD4413120.1 glycoside hydrolase family 38 C-terminal domain-containing protein [Oscillospiraceae bacterium]